jgi:hypothetical protein
MFPCQTGSPGYLSTDPVVIDTVEYASWAESILVIGRYEADKFSKFIGPQLIRLGCARGNTEADAIHEMCGVSVMAIAQLSIAPFPAAMILLLLLITGTAMPDMSLC